MSCKLKMAVCVLALAPLCSWALGQGPAGDSSRTSEIGASYVLGANDLISIHATDADEINDKPIRIDEDGYIRLAMVGRIKASGLTLDQLQTVISDRLRTYIKDPQAAVSVVESHSERVSVLGSVKSPGLHELEGHRTLVEVLALAGGLADDAGSTVKITRRIEHGRIPLPSATDDSTGQFSVAEVNLKDLISAKNPAQNVQIEPDDVVSVPRAKMVYVIGTVPHPGGYILGDDESFSVLKVVSLAGGLDHGAAPQNTTILRQLPGSTNRQEIAINLKTIMTGHASDVQLKPEDILLVPASGPQRVLGRAAEAVLQVSTGLAVYRF
jgi:polysaccharide export outer membrane protein